MCVPKIAFLPQTGNSQTASRRKTDYLSFGSPGVTPISTVLVLPLEGHSEDGSGQCVCIVGSVSRHMTRQEGGVGGFTIHC